MKRFRNTSIIAGLMVAGVVASSALAAQSSATKPAAAQGHSRRIHPTVQGALATRQKLALVRGLATNSNTTLAFGGGNGGTDGVGVVSGQAKVYLIFYGNQWGTSTTDANGYLSFSKDTAGAGVAAQKMFKGIGTNGELWQAELTQWCDGTSVPAGATSCPSTGANRIPYQQNILAGVWYDNTIASPAQATGTDLANEAIKAAQHFGNTTAASNRYAYYVILSPTGTNPDNYKSPTDGYCAWHNHVNDYLTSPYGDMAFSNQPYNLDVGANCGMYFVNTGAAGKLDGYTMTLGHEWQEMMSDQFPQYGATTTSPLYGGWTNRDPNSSWFQYENSDECAWLYPGTAGGAANVAFATGTFAQQASWSNDTNNCAITHPIITDGGGGGNTAPVANFTFTTSALTASFTDNSTDAENNIVSRSWNFGDGVTSTSTNPSHTYAAAGTYSVKETVTDSGGLSSSKTVSVTVSGGSSNTAPVANFTFTTSALAATFTDTSTDAENNIASRSWNFGDGTTATTTNPSHTYATAGTYSVTETVTDAGGLSSSKTQAVTVSSGSGTVSLTKGVAVTNLSAAKNGYLYFKLDVPEGATNLSFKTTGGTGDADLYVKFGAAPSDTSYDCRPYASGNVESCTFAVPKAGTYYVALKAYAAFSGVSLVGDYTPPPCTGTVLCSGVPVTVSAPVRDVWSQIYTINVPAGKTSVVFNITGGTGDADLYVRYGGAPTISAYDCRPFASNNEETCTFNAPAAGTYYVAVHGYFPYADVKMKATISQ